MEKKEEDYTWLKCPHCRHDMCWNADFMGYEVSDAYQGNEVVNTFTCPNCGCDVEAYECNDEEKHNYPFWQNSDVHNDNRPEQGDHTDDCS